MCDIYVWDLDIFNLDSFSSDNPDRSVSMGRQGCATDIVEPDRASGMGYSEWLREVGSNLKGSGTPASLHCGTWLRVHGYNYWREPCKLRT